MKKADANMWWIIIGAVIALVVLIVLMLIFTGRTQPLQQGLSECKGKGGECVRQDTCETEKNGLVTSAFTCPTPEEECCFVSKST